MKNYSNTLTVIARLSENYNDIFGSEYPTDSDIERLDDILASNLPDEISWCGNELLAPIDYDADDFDLDSWLQESYQQFWDEM